MTYRYIYYTDYSDFESEIIAGENPISPLRNYITDFIPNNMLTIPLPHANYDNVTQQFTLLLAVCVSDGLGAVSNTTLNVTVPPY